MKKHLILGLFVLAMFGLVSCVENNPTTPTDGPTVEVPTENPTEPPVDIPTENPTQPPVDNPTENPTEPPVDNPTENPVDPDKEQYGELIIPDMKIYTDFPDTPQPVFTKPEYASEITYTVIDNNIVTYEDGYFSAMRATEATVEATTEHHSTTFKVTSEVYTDPKGVDTANWYLGRVNSVEGNWVSDGKPTGGTLFIGDSFFDTQFWSDFYQLYANNEHVYTHGVSSSTTTDWEIFAKRLVYPAKPSNIVMHLGTNNLYDDKENSTTCYENTVRFLEEIHSRLPETKVYYFAIEPRGYGIGGGAFNRTSFDTINAVNEQMKAYCEANDYMVFVDATPYCYVDGIQVNNDFFRDQTHPKLENYLIYHELLVEAGLDLTIDTSYLNTTEFEIAQTDGVASTNTLIRVNGTVISSNFSISGKLKIGTTGGNPHIQFSLDDTNFQNRFLLWDNDTNGTFNAAYAFQGNHKAGAGKAVVRSGEEVSWEVVSTGKHAYFYINGALEFVFMNLNSDYFVIGAEKTQVSVYDINIITSKDAKWSDVLAREEIVQYEESIESGLKAVVHVEKVVNNDTTAFEIAQTTGISNTNTPIIAHDEAVTNNYSIKGKFVIGTVGNNPHIQFLLGNGQRFLLWDNDNDGSFRPGWQDASGHKNNQSATSVKSGEEASFEIVTTEKHSYLYVNGVLELVYYNVNSTSFFIGAEKTQVSFYDIVTITSVDTYEWSKVLSRSEIAQYEASTETACKGAVHVQTEVNPDVKETTESFEIAVTTGIGSTNHQILVDGVAITKNYSVSGTLIVGEVGGNPHVQFSLDDSNFNNRFLLWDQDNNGSFIASYAFAGSHKHAAGNASFKAGETITWEVVTTDKHSYFYINGELEFVFLNINANMFVIGAEKTEVNIANIKTILSTDAEWANVLAREEIALYEASTETSGKAIVA